MSALNHYAAILETDRRKVLTKSLRTRANYWIDMAAFAGGTVVFATGLILLVCLHMGEGSFRESYLGLSRLTWVNVHRLAACVMLAAVLGHMQLHWRTIVARVIRAFKGLPGKATRADLLLYFGFCVASLAGLIAWFVAPGSPPLSGPVTLGPSAPARHVWIDLHHLSGLITLPAAVIHVWKHFSWILKTSGFK